MKHSKILVGMLTGAMMLSSLSFASAAYKPAVMNETSETLAVMPCDTSDKAFSFTFKWYGGPDTVTAGRRKDTATSVCIKASSFPSGGFDVQAQGSSTNTAADFCDYTIGTAHVSQKGYRLIRNLIYESGKTYARLQAGGQTSGSANGVWSPDTSSYGMNNYPSLN